MSIDVNAGETVNDAWLFNENMNVFSDGIANNTLVDKDSILTVYKGGTINTTIINGDGGEVDLAGVASDTQINTGGYFVVGEDGVASNTTVEGGNFLINSGGIASDTTINEAGSMTVWADGMTGGSTTVNSGGSLTLEWGWLHQDVAVHGGKATLKGDTMNNADGWLMGYTVDSGGSLTVSGCGSAYNGTITEGFATVHSMGKIENVVLDAATVEVKNGAMLSNATMNAGTVVNAEDGANLIDLTVSTGAVLTGVLNNILGLSFDGGTLDLNIADMYPSDATRVNSDAFNYISAGTYSCTLTVNSSGQTNGTYSLIGGVTSFDKTVTVQDTLGNVLGTLTVGGDPLVSGMSSYTLGIDTTGLYVTVGAGHVFTGDVADETKKISGDWTALNVNVNANGILQIYTGGVASKTNVYADGNLTVLAGGIAYETNVNNKGYAYIEDGGSASSATVAANGHFSIDSNGAAEDIKVLAGGFFYAYAGATAKDIFAEEGARLLLTVASKTYAAGKYAGTAFEVKETTNGFSVIDSLIVTTGGTAVNTTVNKDKWLYVESTGLASNTTVNANGKMCVYSGGTARIAYVSGGSLLVEDKGIAEVINVGDLGQVQVSSGGVASNVIAYQYGTVIVSKGGIAGNVTVNKDGAVYVSEGGLLNGAIVNEDGVVDIYGTLNGVTVANNGWISVSGKLTGKMTFETGANVNADPGAILDFDLTQTAPGADALVNDLSFIMGDGDFSYTLTVDGTETAGDYKLAENAAGFDKTITVVNTSGTTLGTISVGESTKTIGDRDYTLTLTGDTLGLTLAGGKTVDLTGNLYTFYNLEDGMYGSSVNIMAGGDLHLKNGASADQTTVNSGGDLRISAGASADDVTANFGADLFVYTGATVTKLTENGGSVSVYDGATVEFVPTSFTGYFYNTIDQWATLHSGTTGTKLTAANEGGIDVYNGGIAIDTTIGSLGNLYVLNGGKVTGKTKFDTGATILADPGAILDFDLTATTPGADALVNGLSLALSQAFSYTLTVSGTDSEGDYKLAEGATGFNKTISVVNTLGATLGTISVAEGTKTIDGRDYTLTLDGSGLLGLTLGTGGVTPDLTGDLDSEYHLTAGKVGSSVNVIYGGDLHVEKDGLASETTVGAAYLHISNGGVAINTTVNLFGGMVYVSEGGIAEGVTLNSGAVHVSNGGTASNVTVNLSGGLTIYEGGSVSGANVAAGGGLYVMNSGTYVSGIVADAGAKLQFVVASDTYEQGTYDGSAFEIGSTVTGYTVQNNGKLNIESGGIATDTSVADGGKLHVSSGGTATGVNVAAGGSAGGARGGYMSGIVAEAGAKLSFVAASNTYAQGTYDGSAFEIGSTATGYTVQNGGMLGVVSGGIAAGTTVADGGKLYVSSGGTATDTTVAAGGKLSAGPGGKLTGKITIETGATVFNQDGSTLDFDLTKTTAGDPALVNRLSFFLSTPIGYTLTVDGTVAAGDYKLAEGADGFEETITVVNTSGSTLGTITVAESTKTIGGRDYTLTLDGSGLLGITLDAASSDTTPPEVTNITPNITAPTNLDVTVTADFTDDVAVASKQYRIGDGAWTAYPDTGVVMTENATVYFMATDTSGNSSAEYSYTVSNIDKVDPTISAITPSTTEPATSVTVTAVFDDNVALAESLYQIGSDPWQAYTTGVTVTENTTITFKAIDTAGNETTASYAVTNISGGTPDTTKPVVSNVKADITAPTKGNVTVTADFTDNVAVASKQYKIGDGAWQDYTTGVVVEENATVSFKAVDTSSNESDIVSITVGNIDKVDPTITAITPSTTDPATSVTVTAVFDDNVALAESLYQIGSDPWQAYTTGVTVTENATITFKAIDTAGNETTASYAVTNISGGTPDTTKPVVTNVQADITAPTKGNVTVTADFTDNVALASSLYSIGDGPWLDYDGGVVVAENTTVYFKAVDTSGNESDIASITISNIDKVEPTITAITPSTTEPATSVTVTAVFDDNVALASKQYKVGLGDWADYTTGVTVTTNTTVYFKAVDTAGNEANASYVVTNISGGAPDTTNPVVSNVKADITAPTNLDVTVTADFSDDVALAQSLYKIDDGAWQDYTGGVVVTENATVFFKAVDTSGNESDVASITVDNIDKVPPTKPVAVANVTAPTSGSVTVTATFSDDSAIKEYSLDGVNWGAYPGAVKFDDNGSVYFRATDAVGNVSEVTSYAVTNIDKVPPAKPTASADITTETSGKVTVTAVFSGDSTVREYSLDGLVWQDYTSPLVFSKNGKAYFRAADAAGNESAVSSYEVTNIIAVTPDNEPDTGWNDYLYDKKSKAWNSDENIANFATNTIAGNCEIYLDVPGTIDFEDMHNMFGNDATNIDTGDVGKISVTAAAKLSFSVKSTADGTFYIYEDGVDKKGNRAQIQVGKVAVKKGKVAQLKDVCLTTTGKYYAAMTAKNVKKAGTQGVYNVLVVDSRLFVDADDGWNNIATNKAVVDNPVAVERGVKQVKLDNTAMIDGGGYQNFVGFSDGIDYAKLNLASTTYLSFDIGTNGNAKFTLWKRDTNSGKMTKVGGVVSLKSKNGELAAKSTKAQLLEVSDKYEYFISMESSDAAKGGSAYYNVNVNTVATRFFDSADGGENNWLYDKKSKSYNDDANLRTNTISGSGEKAIILDNNAIGDPAFNNFVGYQDAADYAKIVLTEKGLLSFQVTALADVSFEIWQKGTDKKGNATLSSLQKKTDVKVKDYAVGASATTVALSLDAGEYYVSVTAKKATANEKGSALYNVTASFTSAVADAQLDSALAASGFATGLAGLDDKSAWQNIGQLA